MADVQIEHGYTRIANEILEAIVQRKFNATQLSVLMIVWRMTYGFNRKCHELAVNYFVQATGFSKRNIQEAVNALIDDKVLIETQAASFNQTRKIAFNKNYDEWKVTSRTKGNQVKNPSPPDEKFTSPGEESFTHKRNIKESSSSEVYDFYHKNIQKGISSSPYVYEQIEHWIADVTAELVLAAMKLAAKKEMRGFDYTEGILKNWTQAGVKTIEDARRYEKEFKNKKKPYNKKDIDWEDL